MHGISRSIRIAMLNADTSIPNEYANLGTFGDILHRVLSGAAARSHPSLHIEHSVFNVVRGEYPRSPVDFDAVVITASAASSYDSEPWIRKLEEFVVMLHRDHPEIRMFGSCFGHHLICQALLGEHGMRVEKHPKGWEIGISNVIFTDEFRRTCGHSSGQKVAGGRPSECVKSNRLPTPEPDGIDQTRVDDSGMSDASSVASLYSIPASARLQFVHLDQVVLSSPTASLPAPWVLVGSTEHCAVQGVHLPFRILTLQGHFEFDKFENRETMRIFGADESGGGAKGEDDGEMMAELVVRFLVETMPAAEQSRGFGLASALVGRLPTPRSSMESL